MTKPEQTGIIFDIERYATKDGPGIRTVVFIKGCGLRCTWCANPESQEFACQLGYIRKSCRGCGRCIGGCPQGAVRAEVPLGLVTDNSACRLCGLCARQCFYNAREIIGRRVTAEEVMETILRDKMYYDQSGGGVTLSGGEPLLQPQFAVELLKACKSRGLHTALETCGFTPRRNISAVLPYLDWIYFDIKCLNEEKHRQFTGQSNRKILSNFAYIHEAFDKTLVVRIPYIPGFNDSAGDIREILRFLAPYRKIHSVEIMPFHCLGSGKYENLGRPYAFSGIKSLDAGKLAYLTELGHEFNLEVRIGNGI